MGGARIRSIKPETWDDEAIGSCSDLARLTFYGLISLADDEGRGRAGAKFLHARLHSYSRSCTEDYLTRALAELATTKRVIFYAVDGENFYWIKNFRKHQVINKPTKSSLPPVPLPEKHGGLRESYRNATDGSESIGVERSGADRKGAERSGTDQEPEDRSAPSATAPGSPLQATTQDYHQNSATCQRCGRCGNQVSHGFAHPLPDGSTCRPPSIADVAKELGVPNPLEPPDNGGTINLTEAKRRQKAKLASAELAKP